MQFTSLIPWEALRTEVAEALEWPKDFVLISGESIPQIGPSTGSDVNGYVEITSTADSHVGMGEDTRHEVDEGQNVHRKVRKGFRSLNIEIHVYMLDATAPDVVSHLERSLRDDGPNERLMHPQDGQPAISLLEFNPIKELDFEVDQHVQSHAVLEIPAMVGYERVDRSANKYFIESATVTQVDPPEE